MLFRFKFRVVLIHKHERFPRLVTCAGGAGRLDLTFHHGLDQSLCLSETALRLHIAELVGREFRQPSCSRLPSRNDAVILLTTLGGTVLTKPIATASARDCIRKRDQGLAVAFAAAVGRNPGSELGLRRHLRYC